MNPTNGATLARHAAVGLAQAVQSLPEGDISDLIRKNAVARLQSVQLAPCWAACSRWLPRRPAPGAARRGAHPGAERAGTESGRLRQKIKEESPWWVPGPMDAAFHRGWWPRSTVWSTRSGPMRITRCGSSSTPHSGIRDRLEHSPEVIRRHRGLKLDLLGPGGRGIRRLRSGGGPVKAAARTARTPTAPPRAAGPRHRAAGESLLADHAGWRTSTVEIIEFIAAQLEHHGTRWRN